MEEKVKEVLERVRPALQMDGGDCELVKVENNVVYLRLMGHCVGCPMSTMTLKMGIERAIRSEVPDIVAVEEVV